MSVTDKITYKAAIIDRYGKNSEKYVSIHHSHGYTLVGELAAKFSLEWGKLAFSPDGEDSSGRQKGRRLTTSEVITQAVDAAELLVNELMERGHFVELPNPFDED